MNTSLTETVTARQLAVKQLSAEEKHRAAMYLVATRDETLQAVGGLSDAQWNFNPSPGQWSILEILEHLAMIDSRVGARVAGMAAAPEADPGSPGAEMDDFICAAIPDRSQKIQAPPPICPTRQWSPQEAVERFSAAREQTIELLESAPCLRGRVEIHPVMGPWDGYQWILATAAHTARHLGQIREVKADPTFPQAEPGRHT